MLQVARLAPKLLGESTEMIASFLRRQQNDDGGFKDRTGNSDLYYTIFGVDGLLALQAELPTARIASYLKSFGSGEGLDFVHLCCLARAWTAIAGRSSTDSCVADFRERILRRIEQFRSKDGGYSPVTGAECGTAYGCFLALCAYQDLKANVPEPLRLAQSLKFLETADSAWMNERVAVAPAVQRLKVGSTNATAAAVTVLRNLSLPVNPSVGGWLLARCHSAGGFLAAPNAPMPDLLSTATALHALAGLQVSFEQVKEKCLDFIDTLWTNEGAFHGHWGDEHLDCEYTFYGLLALGHLSF